MGQHKRTTAIRESSTRKEFDNTSENNFDFIRLVKPPKQKRQVSINT